MGTAIVLNSLFREYSSLFLLTQKYVYSSYVEYKSLANFFQILHFCIL